MPNQAPLLGFFGGLTLNPLKLRVVIETTKKAHPWVTTRHLNCKQLKSVQGFELGAIVRKKV